MQHAVPCCVAAERAKHAALSRPSMHPHTENAPMTQSTVSAGARAGAGQGKARFRQAKALPTVAG